MDITPLQAQGILTTPTHSASNTPENLTKHPQLNCILNTNIGNPPETDEYAVWESENELDDDNQPWNDQDEDDAVNEQLIRTLSTSNDNVYEDEIQQVLKSQGLSPRSIYGTKLNIKPNSPTKSVPVGRPHTRLFTSKISQ